MGVLTHALFIVLLSISVLAAGLQDGVPFDDTLAGPEYVGLASCTYRERYEVHQTGLESFFVHVALVSGFPTSVMQSCQILATLSVLSDHAIPVQKSRTNAVTGRYRTTYDNYVDAGQYNAGGPANWNVTLCLAQARAADSGCPTSFDIRVTASSATNSKVYWGYGGMTPIFAVAMSFFGIGTPGILLTAVICIVMVIQFEKEDKVLRKQRREENEEDKRMAELETTEPEAGKRKEQQQQQEDDEGKKGKSEDDEEKKKTDEKEEGGGGLIVDDSPPYLLYLVIFLLCPACCSWIVGACLFLAFLIMSCIWCSVFC